MRHAIGSSSCWRRTRHASQRRIADELGISLGRVNYCLNALITKGLIKANNFRNSNNKRAYLYLLTPRGIEERARDLTARFLRVKLAEYEILKRELEASATRGREARRKRCSLRGRRFWSPAPTASSART